MKSVTLTIFIGLIVISTSCVSKKKYVACETARNDLENISIRQYKTIDTLKVEILKKQKTIAELEKDTLFKSRSLQHVKKELENVQNLLTSSKKQLNDQMQDMQIKDRYIHKLQNLYLNLQDSLQIYINDFYGKLDSLTSIDSVYKEVEIARDNEKIRIFIPESFFFTNNNRNFISSKGKNMTQILADVMQQHPSIQTDLLVHVSTAASTTQMKEYTDRAGSRISTIYRALQYEYNIEGSRLQAIITNDDSHTEHICFCITTSLQYILETIKEMKL